MATNSIELAVTGNNRLLRGLKEVAEGKEQCLRQALELEREVLRQVQALLVKLADDDPYRMVLERHRSKLEETIADLERLTGGPPS